MSYTLPSSGWTLQGYSIAGVRTGFRIKEKKILLDAGVACDVKNNLVLITHAHTDHTLNLPVCCTPWRPITAVCNERTLAGLRPFMDSVQLLTDCECDEADYVSPVTYFPVTNDQRFSMLDMFKDLEFQTFPCYHSIECTAYGINEVRKKLKPEYQGMDPKELGRLRKSGVELSANVSIPQLLFCGDTSVEFFEKAGPEIFSYPVIMIECTSMDEGEESRRRGHMNIHEIRPWIEQHPEITFILFHHSQKYSCTDILKQCAGLANVVLWIGACYYRVV